MKMVPELGMNHVLILLIVKLTSNAYLNILTKIRVELFLGGVVFLKKIVCRGIKTISFKVLVRLRKEASMLTASPSRSFNKERLVLKEKVQIYGLFQLWFPSPSSFSLLLSSDTSFGSKNPEATLTALRLKLDLKRMPICHITRLI